VAINENERPEAGTLESPSLSLIDESPARLRPYLAQIFLAFLVTNVGVLFVHLFLGWNEPSSSRGSLQPSILLDGATIGTVALALGYFISRFEPKARLTGRWIWILPLSCWSIVSLWVWCATGGSWNLDVFQFRSDPRQLGVVDLRESVYLDLLTYPAWASIWYSLGVALEPRRIRRPSTMAS
jgi:H+/Cl- antiporter ClcA